MNTSLNATHRRGFQHASSITLTPSRQMPSSAPAPARLLTASQAASYLGFKSTELLKNIPVGPVHLSVVGVGRAPRWDRLALDGWLDTLSGLSGPIAGPTEDDVDAELEAWSSQRGR